MQDHRNGKCHENPFFANGGTVMYRCGTGFPGMNILKIGTVEDFNFHETNLQPRVESFVKDRVRWYISAKSVKYHTRSLVFWVDWY